ncbi:MAG: hypothetical protein V3U67_07270 [Gemmatimonadota bacterium]
MIKLDGTRPVLEHAGRWLRRVAVVGTVAGVAAGLLVLLVLAALLPPAWLTSPRSPLPMVVLVLGLVMIGLAGQRVGAQLRHLRSERLAPEIEGASGLLPGELLGGLELERVGRGESQALADEQRRRVHEAVHGRPVRGLAPQSWSVLMRAARRGSAALGVAIVAFGFVAGSQPHRMTGAARVLAAPWLVTFPPPPPAILLSPGDTQVMRGATLLVQVRAPAREVVTLTWQAEGEPPRSINVRVDEQTSEAEGELGPFESRSRYWAEDAAGTSSDTFTVQPRDPLLLTSLDVDIEYASHVGRASERWSRPLPPLTVPRGTLLRLSGSANYALQAVSLVDDQGVKHALNVDGKSFRGDLMPRVSSSYRWQFVAGERAPGVQLPEPLSITVLSDAVPVVQITFPAADTTLGPDMRLPLVVDARDDHGLQGVELVSWRVSSLGARGDAVRETISQPRGAQTRVIVRPVLNLAGRDLLPGDTILYFARARDTNRANRAGVSDTFRVRLPTLVEMRRQAAEQADDLVAESRQLSAAAKALGRMAREAERSMERTEAPGRPSRENGGETPSSFGATEDSRRVLDQARELQEGVSNLEQRIQQMREELARSGLNDLGLQRKLEELQALYEEILQSGLRERIEELQRALSELDSDRIQAALERMSSEMRDLQDQIKQSLALMERVAMEQGLESAREQSEDLARQQRSLADREPDGEGWADEESRLADEAAQLQAELEKLAERLEGSDESEAAAATRDAAARISDAEQAMHGAAESASEAQAAAGEQASSQRQRARDSAAAQAQTAESSMQQASEGLQSATDSLAEDWRSEVLEAVGRATRETLDLAREQADQTTRLSEAEAGQSPDVRGRQASVRQGLENLVQSLSEAGQKTALLDRRTGPMAARAAEQMDEILQSLSTSGSARSQVELSEEITETLNDLAGRLMASRRAIQESQSATGMEEALEQLARMSQAQGGLNQETNRLMLLGLSGQQMASQLQRLAAEQRAIGNQLEELGAGSEDLDALGRLEEMAEEARDISDRLGQGQLDRETISRQERMFRRLLDAGQTLEKDEEDPNRRESETGRDHGRPDVDDVDPGLLTGPRFQYPSEEELRSVPPAYRGMILDYFDRLNSEAVRP